MTDKQEKIEFKSIAQLMHHMQKELKAPKGQFNAFGKYNYRSCEDILEGVKKIMPENCFLHVQDKPLSIDGRFYIEATATLYLGEQSMSSTAVAREEENKKGMDGSQVTGASSSYARKYALNGLFCIDDTKDADTKPKEDNVTVINEVQKTTLENMLIETKADKVAFFKHYGIDKLNDLPSDKFLNAKSGLDKKKALMILEKSDDTDKEILAAG